MLTDSAFFLPCDFSLSLVLYFLFRNTLKLWFPEALSPHRDCRTQGLRGTGGHSWDSLFNEAQLGVKME